MPSRFPAIVRVNSSRVKNSVLVCSSASGSVGTITGTTKLSVFRRSSFSGSSSSSGSFYWCSGFDSSSAREVGLRVRYGLSPPGEGLSLEAFAILVRSS